MITTLIWSWRISPPSMGVTHSQSSLMKTNPLQIANISNIIHLAANTPSTLHYKSRRSNTQASHTMPREGSRPPKCTPCCPHQHSPQIWGHKKSCIMWNHNSKHRIVHSNVAWIPNLQSPRNIPRQIDQERETRGLKVPCGGHIIKRGGHSQEYRNDSTWINDQMLSHVTTYISLNAHGKKSRPRNRPLKCISCHCSFWYRI